MPNADLIHTTAALMHGHAGRWGEFGREGRAFVSAGNRTFCVGSTVLRTGLDCRTEPAAGAQQVVCRNRKIRKPMAQWKDGGGQAYVAPPCGRSLEFLLRINPENPRWAEVVYERAKSVLTTGTTPCHHGWIIQELSLCA